MTKIGRGTLALLCLAALSRQVSTAQARREPMSPQLRLVVILSRHGVRSPTWTQERLDSYSALPWPKWNVPPGDLTSRGYQLVKQLGSFDRTALARDGLFAAQGCDAAAKTYIWADTDQRTVASGKALAEGLFPGCPPEVHGLTAGENDPLFHPTASGVKPAQADRAFAEFDARVKQQHDPRQAELLTEMQRVLDGCAPMVACTPTHAPAMPLLGVPTAAVRGKSDHVVDLQGPLAQASSFAEDLLLEYADGMPMAQVGWGHVDEPQLRRLLALHSDYFDLMHRTPEMARLEASNMLSHIVMTLRQAIDPQAATGALGPPGSRLVVLAGHDTNLAGVAALLGLHWTLDGRDDDTPPGTQLAFELWQYGPDSYSVRITVTMQTLQKLREMPALTMAAPPARATLSLPGCTSAMHSCAWQSFLHITDAAIDKNEVFPPRSN